MISFIGLSLTALFLFKLYHPTPVPIPVGKYFLLLLIFLTKIFSRWHSLLIHVSCPLRSSFLSLLWILQLIISFFQILLFLYALLQVLILPVPMLHHRAWLLSSLHHLWLWVSINLYFVTISHLMYKIHLYLFTSNLQFSTASKFFKLLFPCSIVSRVNPTSLFKVWWIFLWIIQILHPLLMLPPTARKSIHMLRPQYLWQP